MFSNTLDDLPYKWYKFEEEGGDMCTWKELKENFIKVFAFALAEVDMQEVV
jgi:hypothetical protein